MSKYTDLAMERRSHLNAEGRPVFNCCQTTVSVFAEDAGYDEAAGMKAATYFRGGMQMGSVCGAVTGCLMALGLAGLEDRETADAFCRRIRENHDGMIDCGDLLKAIAARGEVKKTFCDAMIRECISCAEQILREKGKIG